MDWTAINHGTLDDFDFPKVLYKYRNWTDEHHDRFIKKREIFLASPSSFEDKKDCKNSFRYDLLSEAQVLEWHENISKREYPNRTKQQRRKDAREWAKQRLFTDINFLVDYQKKYNYEFAQRQGVLSLTAEPCLLDMWDKYAAKDKGFCVGYNSRILFDSLGGGGKVDYCDELPQILPSPFMTDLEIRNKRIYSKEKRWEFEKEYRTERFWENPASISSRQIQLPKTAFKEIILGNGISKKDREEIFFYVNKEIGNIPIVERTNVC